MPRFGGPRVGRVGRPGLIGTAARTAVVAGTATAVSGRVARRQASRAQPQVGAAASEQAPPPPPPPPPPSPPSGSGTADTIAQLKELAQLKDDGILTDAEFEAQKAKILGT